MQLLYKNTNLIKSSKSLLRGLSCFAQKKLPHGEEFYGRGRRSLRPPCFDLKSAEDLLIIYMLGSRNLALER